MRGLRLPGGGQMEFGRLFRFASCFVELDEALGRLINYRLRSPFILRERKIALHQQGLRFFIASQCRRTRAKGNFHAAERREQRSPTLRVSRSAALPAVFNS